LRLHARRPRIDGEVDPARGQKIEVVMSERQLGEVQFLTVAEVASIMRVSKMTVYRMVHAGELPAIRVGRSFRVPEDEVHKYLRSSFVDTA
jgi:excisionase family DNA binding protein